MKYTEKQALLSTAVKAIEYLSEVGQQTVASSLEAIADLKRFEEPMPDKGKDIMQTIDFLHAYGSPATIRSSRGRCFGLVTGTTHIPALAANWLASSWDQQALAVASPVNAMLENICEQWLSEILPVAKQVSAGFVTGATMANFWALAAARSALLMRQGWDVERHGLYGAPAVRVVVGEDVHDGVLKALSLLGFGSDRVIRVPSDKNGRMRADKLPHLDLRTIICLQAGNVNTGAMDSGVIAAQARKMQAWVHIDGTFGLWAGASDRYRFLTKGYELADSWATDCHKWLDLACDIGLVICREGSYLRKAIAMEGAYPDQKGDRISYKYTPAFSRRTRAIELWATLRSLGKAGVDNLITRTCHYAKQFAIGLQRAGYEILNDVVLNQVLVSFGNDEDTRTVIHNVRANGICCCNETMWRGRVAMRISISPTEAMQEDVERLLRVMLEAARKARKKVA